jgi:hypothetical protein
MNLQFGGGAIGRFPKSAKDFHWRVTNGSFGRAIMSGPIRNWTPK